MLHLGLTKAATGPKLQVFGYWLPPETGGESLPEWILLQVSIFFLPFLKNIIGKQVQEIQFENPYAEP